MTGLPTPEPVTDEESAPFWRALAAGEFRLCRCAACGRVLWPARSFCSACGAADPEWFTASGRGTVYTYTIARKAQGEWRDVTPYVIAYVELAEGPRILTNVVGCEPAEVRIGLPVRVVFCPTGTGSTLYRFTPEKQG
jgi:uncharacterized OB-fold protein